MLDRRLQRIEASSGQQRIASKNGDDGLVLDREHGRPDLRRPLGISRTQILLCNFATVFWLIP